MMSIYFYSEIDALKHRRPIRNSNTQQLSYLSYRMSAAVYKPGTGTAPTRGQSRPSLWLSYFMSAIWQFSVFSFIIFSRNLCNFCLIPWACTPCPLATPRWQSVRYCSRSGRLPFAVSFQSDWRHRKRADKSSALSLHWVGDAHVIISPSTPLSWQMSLVSRRTHIHRRRTIIRHASRKRLQNARRSGDLLRPFRWDNTVNNMWV